MPHYYAAKYQDSVPPLRGHMLLVGGDEGSWGIFKTDDIVSEICDVHLLPQTLEVLISDAHKYPPALALARDEVTEVLCEGDTVERLFSLYETALMLHLSEQINSSYCLRHTAPSENPAFAGFYWVLDEQPNDPEEYIRYVSSDFFIYQLPANRFAWS